MRSVTTWLFQAAAALLLAAGPLRCAELSGVVFDPSSAVVPGGAVILRNVQKGFEAKASTGPAGEFRFSAVEPGGPYVLEVAVPGFKRFQRGGIRLNDLHGTTVNPLLELGGVREQMMVRADGQARPSGSASGPVRIRVGGNVQPLRLITQARPRYPEAARNEGREGDVTLMAVVGVDGAVINARVLPGAADAELAAAAVEAVKQWRYEPTRLNGQPVETVTEVEVNFRLGAASGQ